MSKQLFHVMAALLLVSCGQREREPALVEAIDITTDLYHRTKAGYFRPEREPLVLEMLQDDGALGAGYFRFRFDAGGLWVKADERGKVVAYMDPQAFFGHWQVATGGRSQRVFLEWPQHPIK